MKVALALVLVGAALASGCAGGGLRTPCDLPDPIRARCAGLRLDDEPWRGSRGIFGVDPGVRLALADRLARGRVAVVSARVDGCNLDVKVLRCTRPTVWAPNLVPDLQSEPWVAFGAPDGSRPSLFRDDLGKGSVLGAGHLFAVADGPVVVQTSTVAIRPVSSFDELLASGFRHPLVDPRRAPFAEPSFDVSELSGPECAEATHVVHTLDVGAFRAFSAKDLRLLDAGACQPPGCAEPIGLRARPVTRRGCPGASSRFPGGCAWIRRPLRFGAPPPPAPRRTRDGRIELDDPGPLPGPCGPPYVAGAATPRGAAAMARFDRGELAAAAFELEAVASGETGDDRGNVELAQWRFGWASFGAGDVAGALSAFEAIAATRCHRYAGAAAVWLGIQARRSQVPPSEW